jgi:hypothetical protein
MVKQEDKYAKQNNTQYPRSTEYDVALPESSIRIKMADGLPDFFIRIDLAIAGSFLLSTPLHTCLPVLPRCCNYGAPDPVCDPEGRLFVVDIVCYLLG